MQATETATVVRELRIAAPPETVYAFLTEPDKIRLWMGRVVIADPREGGRLRIDHNGFDVASGRFLVLERPSRVVFTWGWETLEADFEPRPGMSTVEFSLRDDGGQTLLRMVHSGLGELAAAGHGEGWDHFLPRLETAAAGGSSESIAAPLTRADEYASRLNTLLIDAVDVIERIPAERWQETLTADRRQANVIADHIASHLRLVELAAEPVALGTAESSPIISITLADIDANNRVHAGQASEVTKDDVIGAIRERGPAAVTRIRAFTGEQLARTARPAFAAGNAVSAADILDGLLLSDIAAHLNDLRPLVE